MRLSLPDADVSLLEGFFAREESDRFLVVLTGEIRWEQPALKLFGRAVLAPRLVAWHGEPGAFYSYSGLRHEPRPWTPALRAIKERVEAAAGAAFNGVLLNLYRDGRDSMSWHSDDEPELGPAPVIASVSFGAARSFQLRRRARRDIKRVDLTLSHGSLLLMRGDTQRFWRHRVPKTARASGPRLNLTFRAILRPS